MNAHAPLKTSGILFCYEAEVSYRHGKLGSVQESRIQSNGGESPGVDFRQPLGEFEESGPRNKAPEMRVQTGPKCSWTLPCSPAQKHPTQCTGPAFQEETLSAVQLCEAPQIRPAQLEVDFFRRTGNFSLMCQCF